jgi:hypothetical protein
MDATRGQCAVCRYRFRLRKDGTVQTHRLYCGSEKQPPCDGSGKHPWARGPAAFHDRGHQADPLAVLP